jgi:hypothetical protein
MSLAFFGITGLPEYNVVGSGDMIVAALRD